MSVMGTLKEWKMRQLCIAALLTLFASAGANAQDVFIWDVVGIINSSIVPNEPQGIERIELEVSGSSYLNANGAIFTDNNILTTASGSCSFFGPPTQVVCELSVRHLTYVLVLDANLTGEISILNQDGFRIESGAVTLRQ
jgi:hypothetical protein